MIAHIRNGQVIKTFDSERGWLTLEDGRRASPPVAGFVDGNDRVVPIISETRDISTSEDTVLEHSETIQSDRVLRVTTIRDKTQAELDEQQARFQSASEERLTSSGVTRALLRACFDQENRIRTLEGRQSVTDQQFKDWVKSQL